MYISRIYIKNFRNFRQLDLPVSDGVTCLIGENNAGKTNLINAVRLVVDGSLSPYRRRLGQEDLAAGLSFKSPEHVLISVEFTDFAGKPTEEALPFDALIGENLARFTYRFRPKPTVRDAIRSEQPGTLPLKMDDYRWEMVGGGEGIDLDAITWADDFGSRASTDVLQQGYLVVLMEALRDVEARLAQTRTSPLQQIMDQCKIPQPEQEALVMHLRDANKSVNASTTIKQIGEELSASFRSAAGSVFGMDVALGLADPGFGDISRGLKVLLSGYGMQGFPPERNGLGLNNILFISMLLNYFERRMAEKKTAGQLLLIEEPEAHLHPQLQRVLLSTLQRKHVQVFITTHSTHITSGVGLASQIVLSSDGGAVTSAVPPSTIPELTGRMNADLERYLDATRSTLLFARGVMLVEGPAEQFLIPPLVKHVMGIDLDEVGISVIPIFGTHFEAYARLFGPNGIRRRCAVVTDGDLKPSDSTDLADEETDEVESSSNLDDLKNPMVEIFQSQTTLEPELTLFGNLEMLAAACGEVGAPRIQKALLDDIGNAFADFDDLGQKVLRTAKRVGKARFAQVASRFVTPTCELPDYIREAVVWLTANDDA